MSAGISAGSVFVSIKADLGPFRTSIGALQKQIQNMGSSLSTSLNFPGQAGRMGIAAEAAGKDIAILSRRFFGLTRNILGAEAALGTMMGTMQAGGIKFTRMGNAVSAVSASTTALSKANPISPAWSGNLEAFNRRLYYTSRAMKQASTAMLGMSAVMLGPIVLATRSFMGFEKEMKRVGILTQADTAMFGELEKMALKMGATTQFSSTQAADGMKELAMGGQSAAQILQSIPAVLNLAAVGDMGMGESAKIIIRVSNAFGLLAEDAGFVADVIAKAATSSSTSVQEMANAFRYVAGTANLMNQSIEETGTLLAILADKGIPASMAGRTLNAAMLEFIKKRAQIKATMGVLLVDPSTQKIRAFGDVLKDLQKSMAGMSSAQKTAKLFSIFGKIGGRAAASIMDAGDSLDEMRAKVKDNVGFAASFVEKMMDSLYGSFRKMESAVQNLGTALGKALAPAIGRIFNDVTSWANALEKQPGLLKEWGEFALDVGKNILYVAFALKAMGATLSIVALGFRMWEGADKIWGKWGDQIGSLIGKFTSLAVTIGTTVWAALGKLATLDLVKTFSAATEAVKATATAVYARLVTSLGTATTSAWSLSTALTAVKTAVTCGFAQIGAAGSAMWAILQGAAAASIGAILLLVGSVIAALLSVGYFLVKLYSWVMGDKEIKEAKNALKDLEAYAKKARASLSDSDNAYVPRTGQYAAELENMKRRKKTQEEINTYLSDQVSIQKRLIREGEWAALLHKEDALYVQNVNDGLAINRGRLAQILSLQQEVTKEAAAIVAAMDQAAFDESYGKWVTYYEGLQKLQDSYMKGMAKEARDEANQMALDVIGRQTEVSPSAALNTIQARKDMFVKEREALIEELYKMGLEAEAIRVDPNTGIPLGIDEDEIKKREDLFDRLLEKLKEVDKALGDLGKAQNKAISTQSTLVARNEAHITGIQESRAETMRHRAFSDQVKNDPSRAINVAQQRLMNLTEQRIAATRARVAAEEAALDATQASADIAKLRLEEEAKLYGMVYGAADELSAAKEALAGSATTLDAMSIGFRGGNNPLEMLGATSVRSDQRMLTETINQSKTLREIATNTAKAAGFSN